ncbi:MAG: universal stress protein [Candidatus Promineifilaceae bacterium]|nr:universal stress protein [Candidatus Promineifilaceae bacterium]
MERFLVAVDEDPQAEKVIEIAGELAQKVGGSIVVCHIMPEEQYRKIEERQRQEEVEQPISITEAEQRARALATDAALGLKPYGVDFEAEGRVGVPAEEIVTLAQEMDADLIVMGFEGLRGLERLRALGSVSRAVMEETKRPVLIVPAVPEE